MIQEGHESKARYWGKYKVIKIVRLPQPVICHSEETGEAEFSPIFTKLEWEKPPSSDKNEFWMPYWMKIHGKEKYGQFSPMIGENTLLQLLKGAIEQDFFKREFMQELSEALKEKLGQE